LLHLMYTLYKILSPVVNAIIDVCVFLGFRPPVVSLSSPPQKGNIQAVTGRFDVKQTRSLTTGRRIMLIYASEYITFINKIVDYGNAVCQQHIRH